MTLREWVYAVSDHGWGPRSEELPGVRAWCARQVHTVAWWVVVWPREWAVKDLRRWLRAL